MDSRRRFVIIVRRLLVALTAIMLLVAAYSFLLEPDWIEVTHHVIPAPIHSPIRIAHLTDLHTSGLNTRERKMIRTIEVEQPDMIVITGDITANEGSLEMSRSVLAALKAPLGIFAVRGNWEIWRPAANERQFYESVGIRYLLNESVQVSDGLWIAGLDDYYAGSPDITKTFAPVPDLAFTMTLMHSPDYFDTLAAKCDLVFAGHLHGGQIKLPLIGPLWLPARTRKYLNGWYEAEGCRMYVSRGIGTSVMNVRFNCRPEIAIVSLVPEGEASTPPPEGSDQ